MRKADMTIAGVLQLLDLKCCSADPVVYEDHEMAICDLAGAVSDVLGMSSEICLVYVGRDGWTCGSLLDMVYDRMGYSIS